MATCYKKIRLTVDLHIAMDEKLDVDEVLREIDYNLDHAPVHAQVSSSDVVDWKEIRERKP